jgi:dTDP-4-amino-4,6-dideoxygalactose transaminase
MNSKTASTRTTIEMPAVQTRLNEAEEQALLRVLREGNTLATGPEGEAFEAEWTEFTGCADSVAVCSCSAALELSAVLSGLGPGDEVIVPAHTFVSSVVPYARTGATLRWADIDPDTRLVTAKTIEPLITPKTKVAVVVHLYGLAADMDPIMALAKEHGLMVVEDCAQAPGARYHGRRVGAIGDFGCFSFHTHKNITTLGEGGMLTMRDKDNAVRARRLRWMGNWSFEGERDRYWVPAMGNLVEPLPGRWPYNFCMGEPNCAVGRLLMKRLDQINAQRQRQADRFMRALGGCPELSFQTIPNGCEHVYHLMSARYDGQPLRKHRDDLIGLLFDTYRVKCIVQYWPLNRTELFGNLGFAEADVPETDRFFDNMISFPWWSDMPDDRIDDMANRTRSAIEELRQT